MLIYLAILTVTNLALGFGLAVYLLRAGHLPAALLPVGFTPTAAKPRRAREPAADSPQSGQTLADDSHKPTGPGITGVAEQSDGAPGPTHRAAVQATARSAGADTTADNSEDSLDVPEVEDDVMAGIEAFRAQLAQMNDEPAAVAAE